MSDVVTRPVTQDPETDDGGPYLAHIVDKNEKMESYVNGKEIIALCGKKLIGSRNPEGLPICETCRAMLEQINAAGII